MADRELPQLPPTQDAEENDHDYDILDDQKLAYHAALTPPSVTRMVDYDTIENLQMGLTQSQYCTPTRGGCLGSWGALRFTIPLSALFSGYSVSLACLYNYPPAVQSLALSNFHHTFQVFASCHIPLPIFQNSLSLAHLLTFNFTFFSRL